MIEIRLKHSDLLTIEHPARSKLYPLRFADIKKLDIKLLQPKTEAAVKIYRPGGVLLAVLLKRVIHKDIWRPAYELLRTVNGDPSNRPGIIGENAGQPWLRKDGTLSPRDNMVSQIVQKKYGGKTDLLGPYRYNHPFRCEPTAWTLREPELYLAVVKDFVREVNNIYKAWLPEEHRKQMEYVDTIPEEFKIHGTAFTTLYVLKNAPTATHTDTFDYPGAFGVMATMGHFKGGYFCLPRFRIAIDYQPGDLLLADVHQLHGNFPIVRGGERVACVFFVRKGQHECPSPGA